MRVGGKPAEKDINRKGYFQRVISERDFFKEKFQKKDIIRKGYYQRATIMLTIKLELTVPS